MKQSRACVLGHIWRDETGKKQLEILKTAYENEKEKGQFNDLNEAILSFIDTKNHEDYHFVVVAKIQSLETNGGGRFVYDIQEIKESEIDIGAKDEYPAGNLSNFTEHAFIIEGVRCASMEGFLQSLKYQDVESQLDVCQLFGGHAKKKGSRKNKRWKKEQTLFWKGEEIDRHSNRYQELLDKAFLELSKNPQFQVALLASGEAKLTHSFGRDDPHQTVLTIEEFCMRLTSLRENLRKK